MWVVMELTYICSSVGGYRPSIDNFLVHLYKAEGKELARVASHFYQELGITNFRWYHPDQTLQDFSTKFQKTILPNILKQFTIVKSPVQPQYRDNSYQKGVYPPLDQTLPRLGNSS